MPSIRRMVKGWRALGGLAELITKEQELVRSMYGDRFDEFVDTLEAFLVERDPLCFIRRLPEGRRRQSRPYQLPTSTLLKRIHGARSAREVRRRIYRWLRSFEGLNDPVDVGTEQEYMEIAETLWALMHTKPVPPPHLD